jgi:hypothetical protein
MMHDVGRRAVMAGMCHGPGRMTCSSKCSRLAAKLLERLF